jgi:hypothetical protein
LFDQQLVFVGGFSAGDRDAIHGNVVLSASLLAADLTGRRQNVPILPTSSQKVHQLCNPFVPSGTVPLPPLVTLLKLLSQSFQALAVTFCVTIFEEAWIAAMGGPDAAGMFDRAPVLFGAGRDLAKIGRQAVAVGTVETVEFLNSANQ